MEIEEALENLRIIAMEKVRRIPLKVKSDAFNLIAPYANIYTDGRSMGAIFKKSLGPPLAYEIKIRDIFDNYRYEGALFEYIEYGVVYPLGFFDEYYKNQYGIDVSMKYPEYELSYREYERRLLNLCYSKVLIKLGLL